MDKEIRLTNFSTCGGWAGKASIEVLDRVLGQINKSFSSDKILVDQKTKDDAAVYKITDDKAIIFTTDFFAPVVDDAFLFGQVAAANAISDVYAMGGKPTLALNICCFADNIPEKSIEENWSSGLINNEKALENNIIWNKSISESEKKILFDPQTSGGLLFTVDKSKSIEFQSKLSKNNLEVSKIGITVEKTNSEIEFL